MAKIELKGTLEKKVELFLSNTDLKDWQREWFHQILKEAKDSHTCKCEVSCGNKHWHDSTGLPLNFK